MAEAQSKELLHLNGISSLYPLKDSTQVPSSFTSSGTELFAQNINSKRL